MNHSRYRRQEMKRYRYRERCTMINAVNGYRRIYLHPKAARSLDKMLADAMRAGWIQRLPLPRRVKWATDWGGAE